MEKKFVTIIAEAGVNHNGSIKTAMEMIEKASEAGADLVKFQTFKAESLLTQVAEKTEYQKKHTDINESQFDMIKKFELDKTAHEELIHYCKRKSVGFLSTPFDIESIDLLYKLNIPFFKIPSGEITNLPYLEHIGSMGKSIVMSTGMATLEEVQAALNILLESGTKKNQITILHCNTEYPTPMQDVNLNAMLTLKEKLGVNVGYSDHTLGIEISIAAVAMGATVIEKHFTLDRNQQGPDHKASLEPEELKSMIRAIRNIENAFGDGIKRPSPSETKNKSIVRKSLVAKHVILEGDVFSDSNIAVKRSSGSGISPMCLYKVIGQRAKRNFLVDELIEIK